MMLSVTDRPSPNHDPRPEGAAVDMLILHYTGMKSGPEALARLRDPEAGVSSHYLVEEDGRIFRLVEEGRRARHAGVSHWGGRSALNAFSIGIEIVNPGHEWGYRPFPALQMAAVAELCLDILARHPIPARHVLAHSDVAPDRKEDPGELFDWPGLAKCGVGLWPERDAEPDADALTLLGRIGYRTDLPLPVLVTAFQRHWRPERVDGIADAVTLARMAAVAGA
ncbi:N-acetylmuramoyl-L-alanine amidase [Roseococcus suduntuyensis]|uniref:N-acetylmuramoyl-L-alanine amidase n=2 Tax=Roseococcus suduntuyensis TaxID=455361 RepID=A0A840AAB9_9PROT|nr:N-acetylmuramoyl-L-alanine amidase [Roseococcus suduntuyensis]